MSHRQSTDKTRVFNPKQNKEKEIKNVVVANPKGVAQVCHTSKNRKKKQNLDAKEKIFNIVHLLTIENWRMSTLSSWQSFRILRRGALAF